MSSMSWPLYKISEPHETNDVVLVNLEHLSSSSTSSSTSDNNKTENYRHSSWSDLLPLHSNASNQHGLHGNRRFLKLLQEKLEEYVEKTRLEKPLVSVALLKQWRNQSPPGRFLVVEENTKPALWTDIGDKKARSCISKALKHMASTSTNMQGQHQQCPKTDPAQYDTSATKTAATDHEIGAVVTQEPTKDENREAPGSSPLLKNNTSRRISRVLSASWGGHKKLYGRVQEQNELLQIMRDRTQQAEADHSDLIMISGEMGVGKTSLARTLMDLQNNDGEEDVPASCPSFFLQGKFEHLKKSDPNAAFVSVMTDFCNQLQNRHSSKLLEKFRDNIMDSLDNDTALLANLVPACSTILWNDDSSRGVNIDSSTSPSSERGTAGPQVQGALAMQRVKIAFASFLQAIASLNPQKPLVVLLDDLHWASEAALDILAYLVTKSSSRGIIFIATFRDEEIQKSEFNLPFQRMRKQLELNHKVQCHSICLKDLREEDLQKMLSEALLIDQEQVKALSSLVYSLTRGNPTFVAEILRNFQEEGLLQFDEQSNQWICDFHLIPFTLDGVDTVSDLLNTKLLDLPDNIQETLKIASCLGSELDERVLQMVDSIGTVSSHLKYAAIKGVLYFTGESYVFASDGFQQAAYALIPVGSRGSYHLKIGQKLWPFLNEREESRFMFTLLEQLLLGDHLLEEGSDRRAVAALCLRAGQHAAKASGFQTASLYLSHGISILSSLKMWGRENYELSLALHNALIEVCYCNAEFTKLDRLVNEVLRAARSFEDSLVARGTQIYALGSRNRLPEAIELASGTLEDLGEKIPSASNPIALRLSLALAFRRAKRLLRGLSDEDLLGLPIMRDRKALAVMQILNHIILYTYYATPAMAGVVILRMVELTVKYGLCTISSVAFSFFALFSGKDAIDDAYRYGRLALKLYDKFDTEAWLCRTSAAFYGCVFHWKHPVEAAIEPLRHAYRVGLGTGDIEYAMLNGSFFVWNSAEVLSLPELERQIRQLAQDMDLFGQTLSRSMLSPLLQSTLNLMGRAEHDPKVISGEEVDDDIARAKSGINPCMLEWVGFHSMKLAYLFSDYDLAEKYLATSQKLYELVYTRVDTCYVHFYESLVLLAQARKKTFLRRRFYVARVRKLLKRICYLALHSPDNFLGKQYLVQAELAVVNKDHQAAMSNYRSAILHSREGSSDVYSALSYERFGKYLLDRGEIDSARPILENAVRCYEKWGALAKVKHLNDEIHFTCLMSR